MRVMCKAGCKRAHSSEPFGKCIVKFFSRSNIQSVRRIAIAMQSYFIMNADYNMASIRAKSFGQVAEKPSAIECSALLRSCIVYLASFARRTMFAPLTGRFFYLIDRHDFATQGARTACFHVRLLCYWCDRSAYRTGSCLSNRLDHGACVRVLRDDDRHHGGGEKRGKHCEKGS
jgi:hypothetical protein